MPSLSSLIQLDLLQVSLTLHSIVAVHGLLVPETLCLGNSVGYFPHELEAR